MPHTWSNLSPRTRRVIVAAGAVDAALRVAALTDLRRRPTDQVRGSKKLWAVALVAGNSAGVLPAAYFLRGRR